MNNETGDRTDPQLVLTSLLHVVDPLTAAGGLVAGLSAAGLPPPDPDEPKLGKVSR